jgi:peptide deformylase
MKKKVLIYPNDFLKKKSKDFEDVSKIQNLIKNMSDTIKNVGYKGFGGLSAVQIGILKRVFVLILPDKEYIVINPKVIREFGGKAKSWEICYSVPGNVGRIKRYRKAEIS